MKDRKKTEHIFRKHHKTFRCGFVDSWLLSCMTTGSPLFEEQKNQKVLSKCFYCFPTLTLKHSLCMQVNLGTFFISLLRKLDFSSLQ